MRRFSSYGPVNKKLHYYVPREELISKSCTRIMGEFPEEGGHYITVWAPRQCCKTWTMQEVLWRLQKDERFDVVKVNLEHLKHTDNLEEILQSVAERIVSQLNKTANTVKSLEDFENIFHKNTLDKPLILVLDEFDALAEEAISSIAGAFRNIYLERTYQADKTTWEKDYLLHSVALVGVRSVLGIENERGSPFNIQRNVHIPNLTSEETDRMFKWYEKESGHKVKQEVIDRLYYETLGQPGLVSWFGELLTEGFEYFKPDYSRPLALKDFEEVYAAAIQVMPNNNILNIISKAKQEPCKYLVLELFKTQEKIPFRFDDVRFNFLYTNGVIDLEKSGGFSAKFSCPFVQKRLFNYFSNELFSYMGSILEPFEDTKDIITEDSLNIKNLIRRYEKHLKKNSDWMLKDAPRRKDLRVFEAVFQFNLYEYLNRFLANKKARVWPEFPTGNGAIDIHYGGKKYGLEIKSYTDESDYKKALKQAALYGKSLKEDIIHLVVFVEYINDEYRRKYEVDYQDEETGVRVVPVFVATGK